MWTQAGGHHAVLLLLSVKAVPTLRAGTPHGCQSRERNAFHALQRV
jgi:hypothetical protein